MSPEAIWRELRILFMLAVTHDADKPPCECVACIGLRDLRERTRLKF